MTKSSESYVRVEVGFITRTENAVYIRTDTDERHWIPRSVLSWECDNEVQTLKRGERFALSIAEWKASEIGLEY